jgi:hypothetical protein
MQEQYNMNGKDISALPIIVEKVIFTNSAAKCYKEKQLSTAHNSTRSVMTLKCV